MTWDIDTYMRAWEFVTLRHAGQTYGGRVPDQQIPYINHLASVAQEVLWGWDNRAEMDLNLALQCALLHDVIEDTASTFEEVKTQFGEQVANGVLALTKNPHIELRDEQMRDSLQRIQMQPKEIWCVKLADRISNLYHPPFYWTPERIAIYQQESQLILSSLGSANSTMAARLESKIICYGIK